MQNNGHTRTDVHVRAYVGVFAPVHTGERAGEDGERGFGGGGGADTWGNVGGGGTHRLRRLESRKRAHSCTAGRNV